MSATLFSVIEIILALSHVYVWIILAYCIATMAVGFNIIDIRNSRFLVAAFKALCNLVEPVLRPIRAILPDMGSLDLAPFILMVLINYGLPYLLSSVVQLLFVSQGV